jgi:hypothetical protein
LAVGRERISVTNSVTRRHVCLPVWLDSLTARTPEQLSRQSSSNASTSRVGRATTERHRLLLQAHRNVSQICATGHAQRLSVELRLATG